MLWMGLEPRLVRRRLVRRMLERRLALWLRRLARRLRLVDSLPHARCPYFPQSSVLASEPNGYGLP